MNAILYCLLWAAAGASLTSSGGPTLFQKPTANADSVVFEYAGDLWKVPRAGGSAERLTTGIGTETDPVFSPDGKSIAFTGQYDGNTDVYVMPASGGVPTRLTYHPGEDSVAGWTNDGRRVLFASSRNSHAFYPRLFTIGLEGGFPEEVPLPMAERGSYSPDGTRIVYEPLAQWQPDWKRYKGGQQDVIWLAKLSDSSIEKLPRNNSNDRFPMWIGDKIYFLSDRDGPYSLYSYDTKSKKVERLLKNQSLDIKSATAWKGGPGSDPVIAYEEFGTVHLWEVKSGRSKKVDIRVAADITTVRPRFEKVGTRISNAHISPTGVRAAFEARGEIITVPAEKGDPRNLTNTTGVMERDPAWSPDGRWIAYFSDESGEYALHLRDQKGVETRKYTLSETPPIFFFRPTWSPDSRKIAYLDKQNILWYLDLENGKPVLVDKNPIGLRDGVLEPAWSPDSCWIAYARQLPNLLRAIFIHSLEKGQSQQVTDGLSDARHPVFDRSGKYLYFSASTDLGPNISFADLSGIAHRVTRSVYAVVLPKDIPSPLAPESDEEKVEKEKDEEKSGGKKEGESEKAEENEKAGEKKSEPTRIDFEGIDQRIIALPVPARNYAGLVTGKANSLFILERPLMPSGPGPSGLTVHKYDLEKRKLDKAIDGVTAFQISANGEKALLREGSNWRIASLSSLGAPPTPGGSDTQGSGLLKTSEMEVYVDPQAGWKQMYTEVWRNERDFFYDRNLHGLNLEEMKSRYQPYVDSVRHRSDLTYLFTEMLNQLTVGHMFIFGGEFPRPNVIPGGLLGADYTIENGRYRLARIYSGENWNPDLRAPLTQPGVDVKAGDYLIAVDGRDLRPTDNIYSFFEAKADKQVILKVGPNPDGSEAREVTVVPIRSETGLRNLAWIEGNRRKVEELSGGRLAYIYLPDTGSGGYTSFNRYFFSQTDKQGSVIDERFNGGGLLADYVVQHLSRQQLSMIHFREGGQDVPVPAGAIYGPKAMLINEMAGSGGDAMPWYFRKLKIGPLIGKRTWGGLIASFAPPPLMDGGGHTAPDAAVYGLDGEWEVENAGVGPDIEVEYDPKAWRAGRDPQLERAVAYLLEELKKNPPAKYKRPPFPDYHRRSATSGN